MKTLPLLISALLVPSLLSAATPEGSWHGDLKVGAASLPIVLHFKPGAAGCTLDSPAQGAFGIPATVDHCSADSIAVGLPNLGAQFCGHISTDEITGTFTQRGLKLPLTLWPDADQQSARPQNPQPPYPYQQVDTVIHSADGTALAGSLTLPQGFDRRTTPICVLVTGSGPQNRDEELFGHRPFAVIADHLGRHGVATFRYDDRGTGASAGDYGAATLDTFRADARAALAFARSCTDAPAGVIGHSEGGTIALLLAEEGAPDFVVSLAGMVVSGRQTVVAQNRAQLQSLGLEPSAIDASIALLDGVFGQIERQWAAGQQIAVDVDAIASGLSQPVPTAILQSIKKNLSGANAYFGSMLAADVRPGLVKIKCPVLALNGSLDTQVDPAVNLGAIRAGLPQAKAIELPGLNHLFQHATTGGVDEYGQISETISPEVLSLILDFVTSAQ